MPINESDFIRIFEEHAERLMGFGKNRRDGDGRYFTYGRQDTNFFNPYPEANCPNFQYGDFRVELVKSTIIIEFESAGGVHNLVKYWDHRATDKNNKLKKIIILHIYMQKTINDYVSHMELWRSLSRKMKKDIGDAFEAELIPVDCTNLTGGEDIEEIKNRLSRSLTSFEKWIKEDMQNE